MRRFATLADGLAALFGAPSKLAAAHARKLAARPPIDITPARRSGVPILVRTALLEGGDAALGEAKRLLASNAAGYVLDEGEINDAGCLLMFLDHARDSLGLFAWNTERFPKSANTWDSLAWAYYELGDRLHAIANFQQDVRLDPKNVAAAQVLSELTDTLH